jgi:hypothetical protein
MPIRKYNVIKNFFNAWSEKMAYCLGFATADGNVYRYTLRFEIQKRDKKVLEFIKNCICPTAKIKLTKNKKYVRLSINSVDLINSLKKFNVIPNKSRKVKIDFNIPQNYFGDYLRGVFDGDGWVYYRRKEICCGICSASYSFLFSLREKSGKIGRLRSRYKKGYKLPLYYWEMDKFHSIQLAKLMYKKDCSSLKRKKDKFVNYKFTPSKRFWTVDQLKYLRENYIPGRKGNYKVIAKVIKKTYRSVSKKIWELGLTKS